MNLLIGELRILWRLGVHVLGIMCVGVGGNRHLALKRVYVSSFLWLMFELILFIVL